MILNLLFGYMTTQCLYVVVKLGIADHICFQEKSIDELATLAKCNVDALYRVMRCLAYQGIFNEKENKVFQINEQASSLLSTNPNTISHFILVCGEELYQAAGSLLHTVKEGGASFDYHFKMDFWSYLDANPIKSNIFNNAMESGFNNTISEITDSYDFSFFKKIIDIGGGKGHLVCTILNKNKEASGIIYDLSYSENQAQAYISSRNLSSRCKFIRGNFFVNVPKEGDAYLLRVILHDWDDEKAIKILRNCRKVIVDHGKLIIIEKVIMDNNYQLSTYLGDINMLVALTGKERSAKEYEFLLHEAGFQLIQLITTKTAYSIIEAVPIK